MLKKFLSFCVALMMTGVAAQAAQYGTRAEAIAMVERAVALFEGEGLEALKTAIEDKDRPEFHDRDLYVFVTTDEGVMVAHGVRPELNGSDLRGLPDASGDYFMLRMIESAQANDRSWVDYVWLNPVTGNEEFKSSYIASLGGAYMLGVGVYLEHQPE